MRLFALLLLLLAAPLSAQQQDSTVAIVTINGDTVMVDIYVLIEHNTDVRSDSSLIAAFDRNVERLADLIAERGCDTCGGASTTAKISLSVAVPLLLWMAISLHRQAGKDDSHTVNNEITVPPREKRDRGEGSGH